MARTYKKAARTEAAPEAVVVTGPEEEELVTAEEEPAEARPEEVDEVVVKAVRKIPSKTSDSVIASPDKEVLQKIVYQPSSQILTREVDPSESFGVGDDMPVYYL